MNIGRGCHLNYILPLPSTMFLMQTVLSHAQWSTNGNDIYNNNSGNVGIGTTGPNSKLHVYNSAYNYKDVIVDSAAPAIRLADTESHNSFGIYGDGALYFSTYTNANKLASNGGIQLMTILSGGNVGIGTAGSGAKLDVQSSDASYAVNLQKSRGDKTGNGLQVITRWNVDTNYVARFATNSGSQEVLAIKGNGNVGIGTSSPSERLQVEGNVVVNGNIAAKYQDLAEWVPSRHALAAGTVVILDSDSTNSVIPSTAAYDTRVAGVVSESPGIVLGEAGINKIKVATTGRVKVRVEASHDQIRVGDLLVASSKEGMAMKSEPLYLEGVPIHRPGTLIGKTLEPLKEGEEEILVLLSLQ